MTSVTLSPDKLDVEFKQHLLLLRSYLVKNGGCSNVSNIAAWIQKLAQSRTMEKRQRNQYLLMLYYQLSEERLEEPFKDKPPEGDLPKLSLENKSSDNDETTESSSPTPTMGGSEEVVNTIDLSPCNQGDTIIAHARHGKEVSSSSTARTKIITYASSSVGSGMVDEQIGGDSNHEGSDEVVTSKLSRRDFGDILAKEVEEIRTKHKFELVNLRTWHEEEVLSLRSDYTDKLEKMKDYYTKKMLDIEESNTEVLRHAEQVVEEKDQEIVRLEGVIQKKCSNLQVQVSTMRGRLCANTKLLRLVAKLERVVSKLERLIAKQSRSKARLIREYEGKLAAAQRKTDLVECTLKLYMMKHREDHSSGSRPCSSQSEISKAVDKLEQKYKEVVATVQVAAIKRRLKDQKSIEHLLQLTRNVPNVDDLRPMTSSHDSRQCTSESGDGADPFMLNFGGENNLKKILTLRNKSR